MNRRMRKDAAARSAFWALAFLAALVSWLQLLWPPIAKYRDHTPGGLRSILAALMQVQSPIYPEAPLIGWIFIAVTAILFLVGVSWLRWIANYIERSRVGISMIETRMDLVMEDKARKLATVRRQQVFHANRPDVSAYHLVCRADHATGYVDMANISLDSILAGQRITKEILKRGTPKAADLIEVYTRNLPSGLLVTFLPNWLVAMLHPTGVFDRVLVKRTGHVAYIDEYSGPESVISMSAMRYPVTNTFLNISFINGSEPCDSDMRGFLIRENAVEEIAVAKTIDTDRTVFSVCVRSLYQETLRVQWKNRPAP